MSPAEWRANGLEDLEWLRLALRQSADEVSAVARRVDEREVDPHADLRLVHPDRHPRQHELGDEVGDDQEGTVLQALGGVERRLGVVAQSPELERLEGSGPGRVGVPVLHRQVAHLVEVGQVAGVAPSGQVVGVEPVSRSVSLQPLPDREVRVVMEPLKPLARHHQMAQGVCHDRRVACHQPVVTVFDGGAEVADRPPGHVVSEARRLDLGFNRLLVVARLAVDETGVVALELVQSVAPRAVRQAENHVLRLLEQARDRLDVPQPRLTPQTVDLLEPEGGPPLDRGGQLRRHAEDRRVARAIRLIRVVEEIADLPLVVGIVALRAGRDDRERQLPVGLGQVEFHFSSEISRSEATIRCCFCG